LYWIVATADVPSITENDGRLPLAGEDMANCYSHVNKHRESSLETRVKCCSVCSRHVTFLRL